MPTYAYRCTMCSHELEAKQSFSDDALTICPECGGNLRKLFSSVGVVFKGSGFYRTDSRSGSGSSASGTSSSAAATSGSSDTGSAPSTAAPAASASTSAGSGSGAKASATSSASSGSAA
ncbi:FmdB family zinc ribbon protein [Georgenia sp. Z1491]|uniref:FmdB family zinc ribbon protein n=1 Tax=Georgenia sp. Z1491 TaxID=3416707 RepID=UPI003CF344F0